jgi:hypothetical protein
MLWWLAEEWLNPNWIALHPTWFFRRKWSFPF